MAVPKTSKAAETQIKRLEKKIKDLKKRKDMLEKKEKEEKKKKEKK